MCIHLMLIFYPWFKRHSVNNCVRHTIAYRRSSCEIKHLLFHQPEFRAILSLTPQTQKLFTLISWTFKAALILILQPIPEVKSHFPSIRILKRPLNDSSEVVPMIGTVWIPKGIKFDCYTNSVFPGCGDSIHASLCLIVYAPCTPYANCSELQKANHAPAGATCVPYFQATDFTGTFSISAC